MCRQLRILALATVLCHGVNAHADAVDGVFTQRSNGFQREPSVGPAKLTLEKGRFTLEYKGRLAHGAAIDSNDLLILDCDDPNKLHQDNIEIATRFCVTRMGRKLMLVDLESIVAFCNAINSQNRLGPAGVGAVVLERDATDDEVASIGELKSPLICNRLRDEIVGVRLTKIEAGSQIKLLLPGSRGYYIQGFVGKCSGGFSDGLFPGMAMYYGGSRDGRGVAWIVSVSADTAAVICENVVEVALPPSVGTKLTVIAP